MVHKQESGTPNVLHCAAVYLRVCQQSVKLPGSYEAAGTLCRQKVQARVKKGNAEQPSCPSASAAGPTAFKTAQCQGTGIQSCTLDVTSTQRAAGKGNCLVFFLFIELECPELATQGLAFFCTLHSQLQSAKGQ